MGTLICYWDSSFYIILLEYGLASHYLLNICMHTLWPSNSFRWLLNKNSSIGLPGDKCKNVYSNLIHNSAKREITQMSINCRIDKLQYMHSMDYYTAKKMNVQLHATIWMNLTNITLSERNQKILYDSISINVNKKCMLVKKKRKTKKCIS